MKRNQARDCVEWDDRGACGGLRACWMLQVVVESEYLELRYIPYVKVQTLRESWGLCSFELVGGSNSKSEVQINRHCLKSSRSYAK